MARVLAAAPVSKGGCGARAGEEHCHRAGVECLPRGVVRTPLTLWRRPHKQTQLRVGSRLCGRHRRRAPNVASTRIGVRAGRNGGARCAAVLPAEITRRTPWCGRLWLALDRLEVVVYTRSPTSSPEAIFHTGDCVGAAVCRAGWRCSLPAGAALWSPVARGLSRRPCTAQFALPDLGRSTECVFVALISMLRCGSGVAVSRGPPFAACVPAPGMGGGGGGRVETRGEGTAGEAGGHAGEKGCRVGCRSFSLDAAGLKLPGRLRRRSLGCLWQPLHVPSCGAF